MDTVWTDPSWSLRAEGGCRSAGIWVSSRLLGSWLGCASEDEAAEVSETDGLPLEMWVSGVFATALVQPEKSPARKPARPSEATLIRSLVREAGKKGMSYAPRWFLGGAVKASVPGGHPGRQCHLRCTDLSGFRGPFGLAVAVEEIRGKVVMVLWARGSVRCGGGGVSRVCVGLAHFGIL